MNLAEDCEEDDISAAEYDALEESFWDEKERQGARSPRSLLCAALIGAVTVVVVSLNGLLYL